MSPPFNEQVAQPPAPTAMPPADLPGYFTDLFVVTILVLTAARFVWRRRDALSKRGASIARLVPTDREEIMLFIWTGVTLVLITFLFQLPSM
jgi:hypothetical protein